VELTRNRPPLQFLYGEIFPIPEPLLTEFRSFSASMEENEQILRQFDLHERQGRRPEKKVTAMFTDPQRQRKSDPGRPELCNVFTFHQLYSPSVDVADCARVPVCVDRLYGVQATTGLGR